MLNLSLAENVRYVKVCHTSELKMVQNFPSKAYFRSHVTVLVLNIFLSLVTIFLNFVTIATFRSSTHLQKKACHFLIFVQSCNDLGIGLIVSPLFSIVLVGELVGDANCDLFLAFSILFFTIEGFSVVILSAMNLERYVSVVHPIYHRNKVTKKKLLIYILSICALFIFVSLVSVGLGPTVLHKFASLVFLLYFVSTVYLYTRIFLVAKAQLKRSEPRVNAHQNNVQTSGNTRPVQQENRLSNRSGNEGNSSNIPGKLSDNQGELSNNWEQQNDNQNNRSDNQGNSSDTSGRLSVNQGERSNNQEQQHDNQNNQSDNQRRQLDTPERLSNNPGEISDRSDNQGNTSSNRSNRSDNQSEYTEQNNDQQSSSTENNNPSNQISFNRKSEKEFLMKFKLAKSCLIVVICSFITFVLPGIFEPLEFSDLDKIFLGAWFTVLVLSNSTLDSLIFFWKNNMLRNEAKRVLKKIWR